MDTTDFFETYPTLKEFNKIILFLDKNTIDTYNQDSKLQATSKPISLKLLSDLMTLDDYYYYVEKLFNDEIDEFECAYIMNGDINGSIRLTKKDIIVGLSYALERDSFKLNEIATKRYKHLHKLTTFETLKKKYENYTHTYTVDGIELNITFEDILYFFDNYKSFLSTEANYKNISKEYLVYGIKDFFDQPKIKNTYTLPFNYSLILNDIIHENKIDIEALNTFLETDYDFINDIVINSELKNSILENMPQNYSLLEQAIYIYIKMCKLLKYDAEFYALNQRGLAAIKHENIDNIKNIDIENNEVVCYEFIAIYAKLLNELGINLEVESQVLNKFGGGHATLNFRINKFIISADSVKSILCGDLIRAKLNKPLNGLKCKNKNLETQKEFIKIVNSIYEFINKLDNSQSKYEQTFDEILLKYKQVSSNDIYLDIEEKLDILVKKLNDSNFKGMDAFSYLLTLRKIIFNEVEQKHNIKINIIRNNELTYYDKEALPSAIITINQIDINNIETNTYYLYNPGQPLYYISHNKLSEKFDDHAYEYIKEDGKTENIPGLSM